MMRNQYCSPFNINTAQNKGKTLQVKNISIFDAIFAYLELIRLSRSENTYLTYKTGINYFTRLLENSQINVKTEPVSLLHEDMLAWVLDNLKSLSDSTERIYTTAIMGFYEFLYLEYRLEVDLSRVYLIQKRRKRKSIQKKYLLWDDEITYILDSMFNMEIQVEDKQARKKIYRDRCLITLLGGTGLRISEAINLCLNDFQWEMSKIETIGKGGCLIEVPIFERVKKTVYDYLTVRGIIRSDETLPIYPSPIHLFVSHNVNTRNALPQEGESITSEAGEDVVKEWVLKLLGKQWVRLITPHMFRHYYLTKVSKTTKDMKLT